MIQNNEERWPAIGNPTHLYGTVSGSLGLVIQISPVLFAFLKEIQSRLEKLVVPVGGFAHDMWRAFKADRVVLMAKNFVDGDLIETVLDLSAEDKGKLVRGLRVPVSSTFAHFCFLFDYVGATVDILTIRYTSVLNPGSQLWAQ